MPYPETDSLPTSDNHLINEELSCDTMNIANEYHVQNNCLTTKQRSVFGDIITQLKTIMKVFFVYGYGGTGKTFLWKTLSTCIRSKGWIVINAASSGIASLLLIGGRTSHSRFHIPLNLNEDSRCYMKPNNDVAKLLNETKLIIWDEAPMVHKHAFEAFDRTLRDILLPHDSTNIHMPFGGLNSDPWELVVSLDLHRHFRMKQRKLDS
ncbi:hypothetical protein E3N88_28570 [Mikania micrantha]|uniref:ATP-dependent DNA helicase n=1 Tax=Mikania micrantha TaxID=192012 RepID=A0A5N6MZU8_9ASTR|nr:hypothetical protein E3N88_28570 [Mikania micrantha]